MQNALARFCTSSPTLKATIIVLKTSFHGYGGQRTQPLGNKRKQNLAHFNLGSALVFLLEVIHEVHIQSHASSILINDNWIFNSLHVDN